MARIPIQEVRPVRDDTGESMTCYECGRALRHIEYGPSFSKCPRRNCKSIRGFDIEGVNCTCGGHIMQVTALRIVCACCGAQTTWAES